MLGEIIVADAVSSRYRGKISSNYCSVSDMSEKILTKCWVAMKYKVFRPKGRNAFFVFLIF